MGRGDPHRAEHGLGDGGLELAARAEELGEQLAREEGKPRAEAIGEVQRASQIFRFFAGEALRVPGEHIRSVRPGVDVDVLREPLGVVGIITPWNFPIAIPAWKIAPALAFGCTVVFKPAELVPASAWSMARLISRAGVPDGRVQPRVGPGRVVGERLVADPRVRGVSFTGSQAVGAGVARAHGGIGSRRSQLEMGGKNPLVILDDADLGRRGGLRDPGRVLPNGAAVHGEQQAHRHRRASTTASSRRRSNGCARCGSATRSLDDTQIGPVVSADQLTAGRRLSGGGRRRKAPSSRSAGGVSNVTTDGYYLEPALLVGTANDMRVNREEIFGPIASVLRADDPGHALALANDTEFGLSAGVCTTSLKHAAMFRDGLQAGIVTINLPTAGVDYHVPFGGTKGSSSGLESRAGTPSSSSRRSRPCTSGRETRALVTDPEV